MGDHKATTLKRGDRNLTFQKISKDREGPILLFFSIMNATICKGYPNGLNRNEIHLYARNYSYNGRFDAMTTDRVCKDKVLSPEQLLKKYF